MIRFLKLSWIRPVQRGVGGARRLPLIARDKPGADEI
jgi:hypothetical protein